MLGLSSARASQLFHPFLGLHSFLAAPAPTSNPAFITPFVSCPLPLSRSPAQDHVLGYEEVEWLRSLGAIGISAFQISSRLGMRSRRVLYYHGLLLRMHPGYSILCLTSIHFSQLRLLVRPLKSEQNGILECPSAMHPKAFFSFSW